MMLPRQMAKLGCCSGKWLSLVTAYLTCFATKIYASVFKTALHMLANYPSAKALRSFSSRFFKGTDFAAVIEWLEARHLTYERRLEIAWRLYAATPTNSHLFGSFKRMAIQYMQDFDDYSNLQT